MAAGVIISARRALLVTAVSALLLGLVGMHQLAVIAPSDAAGGIEHVMAASADPQPGMASPNDVTDPHDQHGMLLHLCLAVLAAMGLLLLVGAVAAFSPQAARIWVRHRFARARGGPRAPPQPVARRLAQLCVLRS